jgi:hypothetical protein
MAAENLSISLDPQLAAAVRTAATEAGMSISDWLARLAATHLHHQRIRATVEAFAAPHDPLTAGEIHDLVDTARRRKRSAS